VIPEPEGALATDAAEFPEAIGFDVQPDKTVNTATVSEAIVSKA
jgi:hypothetical protein